MQHFCTFVKLQEAEDFNHRLSDPIRAKYNIEVALPISFTDSPYDALREIEGTYINIIIGFFGPDNARKVLCLVSMIPDFCCLREQMLTYSVCIAKHAH